MQRFFQWVKVVLNHIPDAPRVGAEIVVDNAVADSGDGAPGDIGVSGLEVRIDSLYRLANHTDGIQNRADDDWVLSKAACPGCRPGYRRSPLKYRRYDPDVRAASEHLDLILLERGPYGRTERFDLAKIDRAAECTFQQQAGVLHAD